MNLVVEPICRVRSGRPSTEFRAHLKNLNEELNAVETAGKSSAQTVAELQGTRLKKRILLVDDDEKVLTSVGLVLENERYDVALAADGYEAISQCQRHRPDLIIVDLNMPLRDGWATLEAVEMVRPLMPMIVITARPLQYGRAVAFGVDALMEKPLDFPVLLTAINRLLSEPAHERLARLTDRNFKTVKLQSAEQEE